MHLPCQVGIEETWHPLAILVGAHCIAVGVIVASEPGVVPTAVGCGLVAISLAFSVIRLWPAKGRRVVALALGRAGELQVRRGDGAVNAATVLPDTSVFPWLVVLRYRQGNQKEVLLLPATAMRRHDHRRLRLWLRWRAGSGTGGDERSG